MLPEADFARRADPQRAVGEPMAFVFRRIEAAEEAVKRLESAAVATKGLRIDSDVDPYGVGSVYPGAACVLLVHLTAPDHEARVCELLRGSGRLVPVPAPESQQLSLEVERLRTENARRSIAGRDVPMAVAAAAAFHEVHQTTEIVSRKDYDGALNIAASLLSRLVPVYTIGPSARKPVQVPVDLTTHRFVQGGRQLRSRKDGSRVVEKLFVRRSELLAAVSALKRAGPFKFASFADQPNGAIPVGSFE